MDKYDSDSRLLSNTIRSLIEKAKPETEFSKNQMENIGIRSAQCLTAARNELHNENLIRLYEWKWEAIRLAKAKDSLGVLQLWEEIGESEYRLWRHISSVHKSMIKDCLDEAIKMRQEEAQKENE